MTSVPELTVSERASVSSKLPVDVTPCTYIIDLQDSRVLPERTRGVDKFGQTLTTREKGRSFTPQETRRKEGLLTPGTSRRFRSPRVTGT